MSGFYKYKQPLPYDPKRLIIYKPNSKSLQTNSWYFRYKQPSGKYLHRSLKETNRELALSKLFEVWKEIKRLEDLNIDYTDHTFSEVFALFLRQSSELPVRWNYFFASVNKEGSPLKDIKIQSFDNRIWYDFVSWRCSNTKSGKPLTFKTISQDKGYITRVLSFAVLQGFLLKVPDLYTASQLRELGIPIRTTQSKSGACTPAKWKSIKAQLFNWSFWDHIYACKELSMTGKGKFFNIRVSEVDSVLSDWKTRKAKGITLDGFKSADKLNRDHGFANIPKRRFSRKRLYFFILISEATLLRPTRELSTLKWSDITFERDSSGLLIASLTTRQPKQKNTRRPIRSRTAVSTYAGTDHILRWLDISRQYGFGLEDHYVFPVWENPKGEHIKAGHLGKQFRMFLDRLTELNPSSSFNMNHYGERITMYSSRHQAIRRRIKAGIPLARVATMANNSLSMISSVYWEDFIEADKSKFANQFGDKQFKIPSETKRSIDKLHKELFLSVK